MKPRITVITLCVDDLERSVRFCSDGLGFRTDGIVGREFEHGAVAGDVAQARAQAHTSSVRPAGENELERTDPF